MHRRTCTCGLDKKVVLICKPTKESNAIIRLSYDSISKSYSRKMSLACKQDSSTQVQTPALLKKPHSNVMDYNY